MGYRNPDIGLKTFGKPSEKPADADKRRLPNVPSQGPVVGPTGWQTPGESGSADKSVHKDRMRTVPEEGKAHPDIPFAPVFKRRRLEGAKTGPKYPTYEQKQKVQRGRAKQVSRREYQKHRSVKKRRALKYYNRNKRNPQFQRDQERRRQSPDRFERRPDGGYSDPAKRSRDWRKLKAQILYRQVWETDKRDRAEDIVVEDSEGLGMYVPITEPSYGSGKVSPANSDVKRRQLYATTLARILRNVHKPVKDRAKGMKVRLFRFDPKNSMWLFDVAGKTGTWRVRVKVPNLHNPGKVKAFQGLDVVASCSCPFWRWQGPEHWGKTEEYLYGAPRGTATFPKIRDPRHERALCKHAVACVKILASRYNAKQRGTNRA